MEKNDLKRAYPLYLQTLKENPCHSRAVKGLLKIAHIWGREKKHYKEALRIYRLAHTCCPEDPSVLFSLGQQLSWMKREEEAQKALEKSLAIDGSNLDAASLLIKLYIRQKKWKKATELLGSYPQVQDAKLDYATIAYKRRNYSKAQALYYQILSQDPSNLEARRGLARSFSAQKKYKSAQVQYELLTELEPQNDQNWQEHMRTRSHTHIGAFFEGSYTKSKENDPTFKAPVVRDFYTYGAYHFFFPINEIFRIDLKELFFHQKEEDIYPPMGINFNTYIQGVQVTPKLLLFKFLKVQSDLRVLSAKGFNNRVFFPFKSTFRFEPGASVIYSDPFQFLKLDAHVESFIIKNFQKIISDLQRVFYLHGNYLLRPNIKLRPELEASFDQVFYHDALRNKRNTLNLWARFDLFNPYTRFVYRFEHSHFRHRSTNYYSFHRQFRNTLGGILTLPLAKRLYFEGQYLFRWEYTVGLKQPIGIFIFRAEKQRLHSNQIIMKGGYRIKDALRIEVAGHLFYSNLPYEDFNVRGNVLWQF